VKLEGGKWEKKTNHLYPFRGEVGEFKSKRNGGTINRGEDWPGTIDLGGGGEKGGHA